MQPSLKDLFLLSKDIRFLNFGSFGATPRPVFDRYLAWQRLLEAEPVQFIAFDGPNYLAESRAALAAYLNCSDPDDLVYVTNPSFAVNAVAMNLDLRPGDEVLATDIEYGACDRAWDFHCTRKGAIYRRQPIRLPVTTKQAFLEDLFAGLNKRTKMVFISHITSTTGLILPVEEVCAHAKSLGLTVMVDGAHVPGHVPLDLDKLACDFYTGACHKWMMAPKGCSFLYAVKEWQERMDPLVVSWGYKAAKPSHSRFLDHFQMIGTRDFSAFLTVPDCIGFMQEHDWPSISADCRSLLMSNARRFFDLLGSEPLSPLTEEWVGQMLSIPIRTPDPEGLQRRLFTEYRIEVPLMRQESDVYLRYSVQAFNSQDDLDALHEALLENRTSFGARI
jgi:isopenicillin-N epimerase